LLECAARITESHHPICMSIVESTVKVSLAERSYDIVVGAGLLDDLGRRLQELGFCGQVGVVTDAVVGKVYGSRAMRSIKSVGLNGHLIVLPAGERTKTLRWVTRVLDELVKGRFERGSALVALGGGVIGDLTGFAASVYLRGIPFIQVPTTLVAQVDSSVGGKTGVNHPLGKNLIGAFYQPRLVLSDIATLKTLPVREWLGGLAEVIKYGMIADEPFFTYLEQQMDPLLKMEEEPVRHIVTQSCRIKAAVVMEDERESNRRRILNYGHTIGHALESLGQYKTLIHGEAVAIGMVHEAALSYHLGLCRQDLVSRQRELICRAGLPDSLPKVTFTELWTAMQHDKKVAQGRLYSVFPERVGQVRIAPLERFECKKWFLNRRMATTLS
jgi:3-dehydroquinate synthase